MSHEDVWSERPGDLTRCTLYKSRDYMYLVYVSADQTRHRILRILRVPVSYTHLTLPTKA